MGVSAIGGIGSYPQPYSTPLSSGPAAAQQSSSPVEVAQTEESDRAQRVQNAQSTSGGNTTPSRGQNLNITV